MSCLASNKKSEKKIKKRTKTTRNCLHVNHTDDVYGFFPAGSFGHCACNIEYVVYIAICLTV